MQGKWSAWDSQHNLFTVMKCPKHETRAATRDRVAQQLVAALLTARFNDRGTQLLIPMSCARQWNKALDEFQATFSCKEENRELLKSYLQLRRLCPAGMTKEEFLQHYCRELGQLVNHSISPYLFPEPFKPVNPQELPAFIPTE